MSTQKQQNLHRFNHFQICVLLQHLLKSQRRKEWTSFTSWELIDRLETLIIFKKYFSSELPIMWEL